MNCQRRVNFSFSIIIFIMGFLLVLTNISSTSILNVNAKDINDDHTDFTNPSRFLETEQESDICSFSDPDCDPSEVDETQKVESAFSTNENAAIVIILFWMQGCEHCEEVLNSLLPQINQTYSSQIYIHQIELKEVEEVDRFYQMAERLGVTKNNIGVPLILIGNQVLTGDQIQKNLSGWIDEFLDEEFTSILMIPEFSSLLPESLQARQTISESEVNQSPINNTNKQKTPLFPYLIAGSAGVLLIMVILFFNKKKSKSV